MLYKLYLKVSLEAFKKLFTENYWERNEKLKQKKTNNTQEKESTHALYKTNPCTLQKNNYTHHHHLQRNPYNRKCTEIHTTTNIHIQTTEAII